MRNNEQRLGIQDIQKDDVVVENNSSKLEFSMPTEIVDLPSEGKYYPMDSSLCGKTSIEIRYMRAKDEDILTNKSLLKKGLAIDRLLQSLIVDEKIKVDDLLVGDKNALVIAARISGYGDEYTTNVSCPLCDAKFDHTFNLSEIKKKEVSQNMIGEGNFIMLSLPRTKAMVECKLLTGKDEKYLSQLMESKKKAKLADSLLTDQIKSFIVSINGQTDKEYINKFVDNMPASDARYLRVEYFKRVPDVNMMFELTCPECDSSQEVNMPLGASFFWPK